MYLPLEIDIDVVWLEVARIQGFGGQEAFGGGRSIASKPSRCQLSLLQIRNLEL